jgi:hypothetical protein
LGARAIASEALGCCPWLAIARGRGVGNGMLSVAGGASAAGRGIGSGMLPVIGGETVAGLSNGIPPGAGSANISGPGTGIALLSVVRGSAAMLKGSGCGDKIAGVRSGSLSVVVAGVATRAIAGLWSSVGAAGVGEIAGEGWFRRPLISSGVTPGGGLGLLDGFAMAATER